MAATNVVLFNSVKRKKVILLIYTILIGSILAINVSFLFFHHYFSNFIPFSLITESLILVCIDTVVLSLSFIIILRIQKKQFYDIAKTLIRILNQFQKGNFTYPYAVDEGPFDHVIEYMQKVMLNAHITPESLDAKMEERVFEILSVLISAMEDKDPYTSGHTVRVAQYALAIGKRLNLTKEQMRLLNHAAAAHDIGKIGISMDIIEKQTKLTEEETLIMQSHPIRGMKILSSLDYLQDIALIVMYHHERYDGKGYYEVSGDRIPIEARIIAVADAFDAMLSDRPYRKALSIHEAIKELKKNKGKQFDPQVVDALLSVIEEKEQLKEIIAF